MVTRVTAQEFPWKIVIREKALTFLFKPIHFKKEGYAWQLCKFNWCHSRCAFMLRRVFFVWIKFLFPKRKATSSIRGKNLHNKGIQRNPRAAQQKNFARPTHLNTWGAWLAAWGGTQLKQQKSNSIDKLTVSKITAEDCQLATPPLKLIASTHSLETPAKHTLISCNCLDITTAHLKASASATSGSVFRNNLLLPFLRPYSLKINPHDK